MFLRKKVLATMLALTFVFGVTAQYLIVPANATSQLNTTDIIFVIDDSASMRSTDPTKLSALAIQKFVEKLPDDGNIRLGIVTYSDVVVASIGLDYNQSEAIQAFANNQINQNEDWTDAAVGLSWAVNEFEQSSDDSSNKTIILIGDGMNDWSTSTYSASEDASNDSLAASIKGINAQGIAIYALALNARTSGPSAGGMMPNQGNNQGGQMTPGGVQTGGDPAAGFSDFGEYFSYIAQETGGVSEEPQSAEDINTVMSSIISSIFPDATMIGNDELIVMPGLPTTQTITVPAGVFEMNLQIDNSSPIDVEFVDPVGNTYNQNSSDVTYVQELQYSNYKISNPDSGDWEISYTSNDRQVITPVFIFYSELDAVLTQSSDSIAPDSQNSYVVTIQSNGDIITDDRADGFDGTLYVETAAGTVPYTMSYLQGSYTVDVDFDVEDTYTAYAELVSSTQDTLTSNELTLEVTLMPTPTSTSTPSETPDPVEPIIDMRLLLLLIPILLAIIALVVIISILRKNSSATIPYLQVNMGISVKAPMDTYAFEAMTLDCMTLIGNANNFSALTNAYRNKCFDTLTFPSDIDKVTNYFNTQFSEVTNAITIKGTKSGMGIIAVPAINDIKINNEPIAKAAQVKLSNETEQLRLEFLVDSTIYRIDLLFSRN